MFILIIFFSIFIFILLQTGQGFAAKSSLKAEIFTCSSTCLPECEMDFLGCLMAYHPLLLSC